MEPTTNGNGNPGTALALRTQAPALDAYEPRDINEARSLAKDFAGSKLTKCRSTEQALLIMATGHELGIPATTALRMIYVADFGNGDTVTLSADLMVALCLRSPRCLYFRCTEASDEIATYETQREGNPIRRASFSNADRIAAKLGFNKEGKEPPDSNWAKYRRTMLMHRAASLLAREVYPDVVGGFYTPDEAREVAVRDVPAPVEPLPGTVIAEAEIVEDDETRIVRLLGAATMADEVKTLAAEAVKIWPKERPSSVKQAHVEAKKRIASAATGGLVGAAAERQPGEDG